MITMSKKYLFFDTETTGLPKKYGRPYAETENYPRIVQLAYIVTDDTGYIIHKNMGIIKPLDYNVPEAASMVHGITEEHASHGFSMNYVINNFYNVAKGCDLIVAHNYKFDSIILACELYRINIPSMLDTETFLSIPSFCTMIATSDFCALPGKYSGYKWPKLDELYVKLFGESFEGAHDALYDVEATVKCFFELLKREIIML